MIGASYTGRCPIWDERWSVEPLDPRWLVPETGVEDVLRGLKSRGARQVLDLGCGAGRHAGLLANAGFEVHALDLSPHGLLRTRRTAMAQGLCVHAVRAGMAGLPYRRGAFDYVLAWNVIYHGDRAVLESALTEIARVLRTGALLQATFLSKRHPSFGCGREVARDTFIDVEHPEKVHPHHYLDERCLRALLYEHSLWPLALSERVQEEIDTYHWHLLAERAR